MPKFDGWNAVYMDNHDSGRSLSHYGSDLPQHRETAAKMLATYLESLSGTLFLLQGQETGMANVPREWGIEDYVDVEGRNAYFEVARQRGEGAEMGDVVRELRLKARNNEGCLCSGMGSRRARFTEKERGWIRTNDDFEMWNVERQEGDGESVLGYWREILGLRKRGKEVFTYGRFEMVGVEGSGEEVFAYTMSSVDGGKKALVLLNFSDKKQPLGETGFEGWGKLIGGNAVGEVGKEGVELKAYEGVIYCTVAREIGFRLRFACCPSKWLSESRDP